MPQRGPWAQPLEGDTHFLSYLTVSFAYKFAQRLSKCLEKSVGLLHLQTLVEDESPQPLDPL